MQWLDWVFLKIFGWVDHVWPRWTSAIALPVFVFALIIVLSILVRRILPLLGIRVVVPALVAIGVSVGLVVLMIQVLLVLPWRMGRARPPAVLYALGDVTVAGLSRLRPLRGSISGLIRRFSSVRMRYLLLVIVVLVWRWNSTYCDRAHDRACFSPYSVAAQGVRQAWTGFWDDQSTNARG